MKYNLLGSSGVEVSNVCLGTMTWGGQNTQEDANQQLHYALEKGINFVDTAEMYSIPPKADTQGSTEKILGNWFTANPSKRENIFLASKISGNNVPWIRNGGGISGASIKEAVDGSLKRLQTDYIDLYQLHWPNRSSPNFGKHWPEMISYADVDKVEQEASMLDILQGLNDCIKAGKIRHFGLSNETPWGLSEYLRLSHAHNLPRPVSLQNEFNLLHLNDWPHVTETCMLENIAYLPWSPMAGGALSGKYRNGARPENCRWTIGQRHGIFRDTPSTAAAIDAYYEIAQKHGLTLAQLSLAWVAQFEGVTSSIIGATSMQQLQENLTSYELVLSDEVLSEVGEVIRRFPMPF
jgi:aryl-alcohol dehydrogenase-like predicted oxidoreductase